MWKEICFLYIKYLQICDMCTPDDFLLTTICMSVNQVQPKDKSKLKQMRKKERNAGKKQQNLFSYWTNISKQVFVKTL